MVGGVGLKKKTGDLLRAVRVDFPAAVHVVNSVDTWLVKGDRYRIMRPVIE